MSLRRSYQSSRSD